MGAQGRLIAGSLIVLALLLAAVGCGDSSESSEGTTASISKAAFTKKANEICERTRETYTGAAFAVYQKKLKEQPGTPSKEVEYQVIDELYGPTYRKEIEEIRELGIPEGDEQEVEAILSSLEEVLDKVEANPKKFTEELAEYARPYRKVAKLSRAYGIKRCGEP